MTLFFIKLFPINQMIHSISYNFQIMNITLSVGLIGISINIINNIISSIKFSLIYFLGISIYIIFPQNQDSSKYTQLILAHSTMKTLLRKHKLPEVPTRDCRCTINCLMQMTRLIVRPYLTQKLFKKNIDFDIISTEIDKPA